MSRKTKNDVATKKIGEAHNLFAGITGEDLAEHNIFTRSSPIGRKSLKRILSATGDPFDVKRLKIEDNFTNQNADILEAYLKAIGLRLEFVTKDPLLTDLSEDIQEFVVYGRRIVDYGYRKPVYKALFDKYMEYMESRVYIGLDKDAKSTLAWNWVFEQDDIKTMDMKGLTKEDFLSIITNPNVDIEKEKKNIRMSTDGEETLDEDDNLSEEDEIESEAM